MTPEVLRGLKRVKRTLMGYCWIWFVLFVFNIVCSMLGDQVAAVTIMACGLLFVLSFLTHGLVKSFLCGVENKPE